MCQMGETGNITCLVSHGYQKLLPSQPRAADAHISYTANEAVMLEGRRVTPLGVLGVGYSTALQGNVRSTAYSILQSNLQYLQ